MGRSNLGKLLHLKARAADEPPAAYKKRPAAAPGGGGQNKRNKRSKPLAADPRKKVNPAARAKAIAAAAAAAAAVEHHASDVDMELLLSGHASAYESLVGALSGTSSALRLRRLQQEGGSDEEEEESEEQEEEEGEDGEEALSDLSEEEGEEEEQEEEDEDEEAARLEEEEAAAAETRPLDSWSRRGLQAAAAAATAAAKAAEVDPEGAKLQKQLAKQAAAKQQPQQLRLPAASATPVPDSWAAHVDRELGDAELAALQGAAARPKLADATEHSDYKVWGQGGEQGREEEGRAMLKLRKARPF